MVRTSSNSFDYYEKKARSKDPHDLLGRPGRKYLTEFISKNILGAIALSENDKIVDIGCGDGTLLRFASPSISYGIGIVPTAAERERVASLVADLPNIDIRQGMAWDTHLESACFDKIICNGVLLYLTPEQVEEALLEMKRITRKSGVIYIGEVPAKDELKKKKRKRREKSVLRAAKKGMKIYFKKLKKSLKKILDIYYTGGLVREQQPIFYCKEEDFIKIAEGVGLEVVKSFRHKYVTRDGMPYDSETRMNYIFVRK